MAQNKPKSKRGRKPKAEWQRLRNEIKLHLDDGNYAVVKDMARESGLSLNKFITCAVMGATIRKALTDDEYSMVRSLQAPQPKAERRCKTLNIRDIRCFVRLWGCAEYSISTNPSDEQSRTEWR